MIESTRNFGGRRIITFAWRKIFAGVILSIAMSMMAAGAASAETRTLKLYFIHTHEHAEITFKRNGRYIPSGLKEMNRFLRDWRRNEPTNMDPRLLDTIWEIYQKVGARDYINVVSAYRSPATNSMLRSRSKGVAKKSQHMLGKAMDFFIPGIKLSKLRATALKMQHGGVGYYPTSGSPFVHVDVGNVRHWPRMRRSELLALFPDGKTMHVPTDGKPLKGYNQALAAYKAYRNGSSSAVQVASADEPPRKGLLATLFGGGADDEEDSADNGQKLAVTVQPSAPEPVAAAAVAAAPQPLAPAATPETILAALPPRAVPLPRLAPRPSVNVGQPALALVQGPQSPVSAEAAAAAIEQLEAEPAVEVALDIPIPTRRPAYTPLPEEQGMQIADAAQPGRLPVPGGAPGADIAVAQGPKTTPSATVAAYLPLSANQTGGKDSREYVLASLPDSGPSYGAPPLTSDGQDVSADRGAKAKDTGGRLARLSAASSASPRLAMISSGNGKPTEAMATGVRTTAKGARPGPADLKPDPHAVLVPIPQQLARWALNPAPTAMEKHRTRAPSFAEALVRSSPQMVYTAGFGSKDGQSQPNRFTGKAVTFLSVARFDGR